MVKKCNSETKEDKRAAALRANLRRRKDKAKSVKQDAAKTQTNNKDE